MIELLDVSRDYDLGGRPVHALRHVTLTVRQGDYVSLMGPSGSGKSSLLNVVGCLDRPTSGDYRLEGRNVATLDESALAAVRGGTIGFIFQSFNLVNRLTAAGNVELPMIFAGVPRAERVLRVHQALDSVHMTERAEHRPAQLSGGERQRIAIARAIVMGPAVLLADEPTGNLDRATGGDIVRLLESMHAEGLTLIVVTHDPVIGGRAARQLHMLDGSVTEQAPAGADRVAS
jgi:putative ABC transport system ATP-binding protein